MNDLKGMFTFKGPSFVSAVKNPSNLVPGLIVMAVAQVAQQFGQWRSVQEATEMAAAWGLDISLGVDYFIKSGVFGFIGSLVFAVALYFVSIKLFKGKADAADMKGFVGVMGLLSLPLVLYALPMLGFVGGLYSFILIIFMLMSVHKWPWWMAFCELLLTGLVIFIVLVFIAGVIGIGIGGYGGYGSEMSFDVSY